MKLPRRRFLHLVAGAAALPVVSRTASAQAYPARAITLIVPFPPGGSTDVAARIVADHMSRTLGQQVVVQNVSGAGGTTGSTRAMRADPDGYTILMGQMGTHAASVALYPNLAYKPAVDFEPIGLVTGVSVDHRGEEGLPGEGPQGIRRLSEGELRLAQPGACRRRLDLLHHLPAAQFDRRGEADAVPFNGGAPAMNALVGGQVDYMCADIITGGPHHEAGKIKVYAIASPARNPALAERADHRGSRPARVPGVRLERPVRPKGTPKPILDRLVDALDKALDDERHAQAHARCSAAIFPTSASAARQPFLALVKSEIARWSPIIKAANVKIE